MALYQGLQQKLQQKLSPQQIQLMKLLQVPTALLEERIKEEIEDNPALDTGQETDDVEEDEDAEALTEIDNNASEELSADDYDEPDVYESYLDEDEVGEYKLRDDNVPELAGNDTIPHPVSSTLNDNLTDQLALLNLDDHAYTIAEQIIGSIDDDGYLHITDFGLHQTIFDLHTVC
jgi:RNA polymerase sigma-54 factor